VRYKVALATPVDGHPDDALVHLSVQQQQRRVGNILRLDELANGWVGSMDLVRARDRLARMALFESDVTHVLNWDCDVHVEDLELINRMLETGHDCIGAPYRRKKQKEEYPYRPLPGDAKVENGCVEVAGLAFGFMLTSRKCLEQMWNAYLESRWYMDVSEQKDGKKMAHLTVSMFDLVYSDPQPGPDGNLWRIKFSEDYSFCDSYRRIGGKVHMFVGEGSPVGHIGSHVFKGTREGLVGV
jgi:hypothetical protein